MARVVLGHYVLHKYSTITRGPLPLIRKRIARFKRLEQLVVENAHEAVPQPVDAVVVIEGVLLVLAQVGTDRVGLVQYLVRPYLRHYGLHGPVVVARPAETVALTVRSGQIAIEV